MKKMNKKAKKRLMSVIGISFMILLIVGIFAASFVVAENEELSEEEKQQVQESVTASSGEEVAEVTKKYVEEFAAKRKVDPEKINNVSEVDFEALPKEVNIENVQDTNLAIYEVNYNESKLGTETEKKLFVITYSTEKVAKQGDIIVAQDKRQFLDFGFAGESQTSSYLKTSAGVETSAEKGYVMVREGSITAVSTNIELISGIGEVEIIVYKNGEPISFGNTIEVDSFGVKKDHDVQSKGSVNFEAGDVISVYVSSGNVAWKDAITMVEITTTS